jgi:hypothetical protein
MNTSSLLESTSAPTVPLRPPAEPKFSLFAHGRKATPCDHLTGSEFIDGIKDGRWLAVVDACRDALHIEGKAAYNALRETTVPAAALSAFLKHRRKRTTLEQKGAVHSGYIQLDFDSKDHDNLTLEEIRKIAIEAPFVVACFISLSGTGVKAVGLCPADFDLHLGSWLAAEAYYQERGLTLDPSTKDPTRLCFVSFDPQAFYWEEAFEIEPLPVPEKAPVGSGSNGTEDPEHVCRVLAELAEKIGPQQKRNPWLHICACVKDAVGAETAGEIVDIHFPPLEKWHESACDVMASLPYGEWLSLRKYGIDPVDYVKLLPELSGDAGAKVHSSIVWGVNSFPATVPPDTVILGNAWLRRADIAHLISTAGAGKSVAMIQAAMAWALGLPYFGIRPPQPLRILLFSGEDDRVTLGQCRAGFLEHSEAITGQKLTAADLEPLDSMLRTEFSREYVGERFHTHLARLLTESPADLVIINPLLSYVGGEIVACASNWLRAGLMPVLQQHDCAALLAHHTGKMAKDGWDNTDDTYSGIGGGEVANVPRTILVLRPTTTDGLSVVKVCKRKTTGWRDAEGNFTTSYFVKQSSDPERPAWIPVPFAEAHELVSGSKTTHGGGNNRRKVTPAHVVEALAGGPMNRQDLIASLRRKCDCSEKPAKEAIDSAEFDELILSFTEKNPNGGNPIKWFRIAEDGEQGVV